MHNELQILEGLADSMSLAGQLKSEVFRDGMVSKLGDLTYNFIASISANILSLEEFKESVSIRVGKKELSDDELYNLIEGLAPKHDSIAAAVGDEYKNLMYDVLANLDIDRGVAVTMTKDEFLDMKKEVEAWSEVEKYEIGEALTVLQEAVVSKGLHKSLYDKLVEVGAALFNVPLPETQAYMDDIYNQATA